MITETSTLADVAFEVCTALDAAGFVAVLTGGSAATVHAPDAYQSKDLDFVLTLTGTGGDHALQALGFRRSGQFYAHDRTHFTLDFPNGPLGIRDDLVKTWDTARRKRPAAATAARPLANRFVPRPTGVVPLLE